MSEPQTHGIGQRFNAGSDRAEASVLAKGLREHSLAPSTVTAKKAGRLNWATGALRLSYADLAVTWVLWWVRLRHLICSVGTDLPDVTDR
jgi:hypothetical protein